MWDFVCAHHPGGNEIHQLGTPIKVCLLREFVGALANGGADTARYRSRKGRFSALGHFHCYIYFHLYAKMTLGSHSR